jgi:hypothetical protein
MKCTSLSMFDDSRERNARRGRWSDRVEKLVGRPRQERRERLATRKDQTDEWKPQSISKTTVLLCEGQVDNVSHAQVRKAAKGSRFLAVFDSVSSPQSMLFSIFSDYSSGDASAPELSRFGALRRKRPLGTSNQGHVVAWSRLLGLNFGGSN